MTDDYWGPCGEKTPRMKGPCVLPQAHLTHQAWRDNRAHRSAPSENEDTPKLSEFRRVVETGLDNGVQLSYLEIGEIIGGRDLRIVREYGLGSRYTKLRQKIFKERGVKPDGHRRTAAQSAKIVADMRSVL